MEGYPFRLLFNLENILKGAMTDPRAWVDILHLHFKERYKSVLFPAHHPAVSTERKGVQCWGQAHGGVHAMVETHLSVITQPSTGNSTF